MEKMQKSKFMI